MNYWWGDIVKKVKRIRRHNTAPQVIVTQHAIQRFLQRGNVNYDMSVREAANKIINQVLYSKLLSISGDIEHRLHKGNVFVIRRDNSCQIEKLIVITMKITKVGIRERYSQDFNMKSVDYNAVGF